MGVSVERVTYHGWCDCFRVANSHVEALIVPAIGRVMQFRFEGAGEGAFWENRELDGCMPAEHSSKWMNFGGDKCWPAPQSAWPEIEGRKWPPPRAIDSTPMDAAQVERGVKLTSAIDEGFGIQVERVVRLDPDLPQMTIQTTFHKRLGNPVTVAVWTITQMRDPVRMCALLPQDSRFANGYVQLMPGSPKDLSIDGRVLSLARDPSAFVKFGTDATSLEWIGPDTIVRIETERLPGEYPEGGCVTEIYTNPDPMKYVELETLGPLVKVQTGDATSLLTTYSLRQR